MSRALICFALASSVLLPSGAPQSNAFSTYRTALKSSNGLIAAYTVNVVGSGREAYAVELSKPNLFRIDKDSELIVGDGKTITWYKKAAKTYIRKPETDAELHTVFSGDDLAVWSPFFEDGAFAGVAAKDAGTKNRKGLVLKQVDLTFSSQPGRAVTLYVNSQDGLLRQAELTKGSGDGAVTTIIDASSLKLDAVEAARFAFTPPSGATEISEADLLYGSKVQGGAIADGSGTVRVTLSGLALDLYTYKPANYKKGLFLLVFHGLDRHPEVTRDSAKRIADQVGALVVAPDFDAQRFDAELYQSGGVRSDGANVPKQQWTFSRVPELIYFVRKSEQAKEMPVYLLGHSAGGQFVGRLTSVMGVGAIRYVAANPSAYVFPTTAVRYGYGLGGLPTDLADDAAQRRYLAEPLTIYLGQADTGSKDLDTSERANQQGPNRLERGRNFFKAGKELAAKLGCPFNWKLVEVAGIGHSQGDMYKAPQVMNALFGDSGRP